MIDAHDAMVALRTINKHYLEAEWTAFKTPGTTLRTAQGICCEALKLYSEPEAVKALAFLSYHANARGAYFPKDKMTMKHMQTGLRALRGVIKRETNKTVR